MRWSEDYEATYDKHVYHRDWYIHLDDYPPTVNIMDIMGHNMVHTIYMFVVCSSQKGFYCTTCDTFNIGMDMDPPLDDAHPKEDRITLAEFREVNDIRSPEDFVKWIKTERELVPLPPELRRVDPEEGPLNNAKYCQVPGVNKHHFTYRGLSPIISLNITDDADELAGRLKDMYLSIAARDHRIEKLKCMLSHAVHELCKKGDNSQRSDLNYALSHT